MLSPIASYGVLISTEMPARALGTDFDAQDLLDGVTDQLIADGPRQSAG